MIVKLSPISSQQFFLNVACCCFNCDHNVMRKISGRHDSVSVYISRCAYIKYFPFISISLTENVFSLILHMVPYTRACCYSLPEKFRIIDVSRETLLSIISPVTDFLCIPQSFVHSVLRKLHSLNRSRIIMVSIFRKRILKFRGRDSLFLRNRLTLG